MLNVAMQTARQHVPGGKKGEYEEAPGTASAGRPAVPPRPHNVHFAEPEGEFTRLEKAWPLLTSNTNTQVPIPPRPTN